MLGFKGINELINPGVVAPYTGDSTELGGVIAPFTRDARNVWFRDGKVYDRDGCATLGGSTAAADTIDGLFAFTLIGDTRYLVRVTQTTVAYYTETAGVWTNITGAALTGTANTLVDGTVIDDILVFTNGKDRLRKWAGTGDTTEMASGVDIFGKTVVAYQGFLLIGNWSTNGTTFQGVEIIFADSWDEAASWSPCATNIIVVDETPGEVLKMGVLDRTLMVYKRDSVIKITYISGQQGFRHELMPFDMGILAPNSLVTINRVGHVFLARDKQLYLNDGQTIRPVPLNVSDELRDNMLDSYAKFACAANDFTKTTCSLFYPKTAASTWLDGRIDYNYVTGEFAKGDYQDASRKFHRVASFAFTDASTVRSSLVASDDNKLVYRLDTTADDAGTAPTRYFTTDWTNLGHVGTKFLPGGMFVFSRSPGARVRISVSEDYNRNFHYPQTFSLSGVDTASTDVVVKYDISAVFGEVFNFKVEFMRENSTAQGVLRSVFARFVPVSNDMNENQPRPQARGA